MWKTAPLAQNFFYGVLALNPRKWVGVVFIASQETMGILLMLLFLLGKGFYDGVATYFNMENKKVRELKRYITIIDDLKLKLDVSLIKTKYYIVLVFDQSKTKYNTLIHSHNLEIERCCEEEREGSFVPIFPLPSFGIMWILAGWMGFCSKVSPLWIKRGRLNFELKKEFYIEFRVLLITSFLVVGEAFITHDTNLVSWLGLLLFREEFGMLLTWFGK